MSFDTIEINLVLSKSVQNAMKHVPTTQLFSVKGGGGVTHPPYINGNLYLFFFFRNHPLTRNTVPFKKI